MGPDGEVEDMSYSHEKFKTALSIAMAEWNGKESIGAFIARKNKAYGNSFAIVPAMMRLLYPSGVRVDEYDDFLLLVRDADKSVRIANGSAGEENPWKDKAGYAILAVVAELLRQLESPECQGQDKTT